MRPHSGSFQRRKCVLNLDSQSESGTLGFGTEDRRWVKVDRKSYHEAPYRPYTRHDLITVYGVICVKVPNRKKKKTLRNYKTTHNSYRLIYLPIQSSIGLP